MILSDEDIDNNGHSVGPELGCLACGAVRECAYVGDGVWVCAECLEVVA